VSKTKRAYKYRISPTDEQKRILAQTFGCCRFVYNRGLSTRKTAYFQHGQKLTSAEYGKIRKVKISNRANLYRKENVGKYLVEDRGMKSGRAKKAKAKQKQGA
jgi:transposase